MKMFNRLFTSMLALGLVAAMFSCNSSTETKTTESKKMEDTATTVVPPPPPAFTPIDILEVSHSVKDYAKWKLVFDADSVNRKAAGLETLAVATDIDKPKNVLIVLRISDLQKAKAFAADPRLKEVMSKAGVSSKPNLLFSRIIRHNPDATDKQLVMITHKVKDFDAWVKVYDGEGTTKRLSEGMVDAGMTRGIDDPDMIQVLFDTRDIPKAKAAILSEEKKNLMMNAGVEGKPIVTFYKSMD